MIEKHGYIGSADNSSVEEVENEEDSDELIHYRKKTFKKIKEDENEDDDQEEEKNNDDSLERSPENDVKRSKLVFRRSTIKSVS